MNTDSEKGIRIKIRGFARVGADSDPSSHGFGATCLMIPVIRNSVGGDSSGVNEITLEFSVDRKKRKFRERAG